MKKLDAFSVVIVLSLIGLCFLVWWQILFVHTAEYSEIYFLDVGQGDAELVVLPGHIKILTDAGPDQKILRSLAKVLSAGDNYIDLGIISHPQLDHFNGYNFILDHYRVGAFIFNGRDDTKTVHEWPALLGKIKAQNIPLITLAAGDRVRLSDNQIDFLSPGPEFIQSAELNDTGFVELVKTGSWRALLTADVGFNIEDYLVKNGADIRADILKVPHHGSKYSSGDAFLHAVGAKAAVIEVGEYNKYGHPTKEALGRLASSGAKIFRTDQNGTVEVVAEGQKLKVFVNK